MAISFRNSLSLRTGILIMIGAALQTLLLSVYFYQRIYQEQLIQADRQIQQLVSTVESSAAVAAYLDNQELATEVVRGLASNDIVATASLSSTSEMRIVSGAVANIDETQMRRFTLKSPFMPDESIGTIALQPNSASIQRRASDVAQVYVFTLVAHSLGLTLLVIGLIHWLLTRPLKSLAESLHVIEPGSIERLPAQRGHKSDEVGQLVSDVNGLLESAHHTLEAERRLRQYVESVEKRFRLIFEEASCGIALVDRNGRVKLSNPSFEAIIASILGDREIDDLNFMELFDDASLVQSLLLGASQNAAMSQDLQLASPRQGSRRWLHALFSSVRDEKGEWLIECILYDISERARREQQARHEAERDVLTQLYNRRAGERLLENALQKAQEEQKFCALMLLDLDRFKPINDTYGHEAGDHVLVTVASRLIHTLRDQDLVIRWGGDEFVVLAGPCNQALDVLVIAEKLLHQISQPIDLPQGRRDHVGASIGVALFPAHGDQLADLINKADQAMYDAKQRGRNQYLVYGAAEIETTPKN